MGLRSWSDPSVLPTSGGDVVALGQALVGQDPGGVGGGGQADDAAAGEGGPQAGELGHGVALAPAGVPRTVVAAVPASIMTTASHCSAFSPVCLTAAWAWSRPTSCGTARLAAARICSSMSRWARVQEELVRRPVDAAAVGGTDSEAGHVRDIGHGDLDDVGAGPAADGQTGHLVDHRRAVDARLEDWERPVHLEPELGHRPHHVMLLHLGDGDPRGSALGVIQRGAYAHGALAGGVGRDLLVHRGQRLDLLAVCASHAASRCASFGSAAPVSPATAAAGLGFGTAGVLPGLLVQQPQRPPAGRLARTAGTAWASRSSSPVTATARELNWSLTFWPTPLISAPLPSGRGTMAEPSPVSLVSSIRSATGRPRAAGCAVTGNPGSATSDRRCRRAVHAVPDRDAHAQPPVAVAGQGGAGRGGGQPGAVRRSPVRAERCPVRV